MGLLVFGAIFGSYIADDWRELNIFFTHVEELFGSADAWEESSKSSKNIQQTSSIFFSSTIQQVTGRKIFLNPLLSLGSLDEEE